RGEHEDAEGVAQRVPEVSAGEDIDEVLRADELALTHDQVPVVDGHPPGVDQGEEPGDEEQDEEGREVEVGTEPEVPPAEPAPETDTPRGRLSLLLRGGTEHRGGAHGSA